MSKYYLDKQFLENDKYQSYGQGAFNNLFFDSIEDASMYVLQNKNKLKLKSNETFKICKLEEE